ncbi:coiled-coil domain-containing glutamate-rich protein 2 [Eublepharis macularius]|uniref:Secretogranin-1 n=1 Tax=Eublepharis macularius TaxID=481883 RepID=A0AA97KEL2_EUBMA|nr:coiled-coil domain-containing glutamate-rich protein 2 [Eublepharis macularius]
MLSDGVSILPLLFLCQAYALPLASQLSEEDEKVTRCITEVLADTLSKPSPVPVTSECMKILREDERVLAMLHHQHLLTELEDLAHQENAKHRLGHEDSRDSWEREGEEQEEVKKREARAGQQREATASEKMQDGEWKEEGQGLKEFQKTEKIEEKLKEVSHGEDKQEALEEEAAKEEMEDEGEEDRLRKNKKRSSSETWSSQEYFGHVKNRGPGGPKIREVMLQGNRDSIKRNGSDKKRPFELEGEEEVGDSSEEKPRSRYHHHGGRHHEDWEDEEEEEKKRKMADLTKRVAEKASDEETAQFEEEEKGVKISNSKGQLHGGWKPWPEEEEEKEEGEMRYGHHHQPAGLDLKKRHWEDYPKGRHHGREEDEGEREAGQNEAQELQKLEEIEYDLQKAAEKLQELKRGSSRPAHQGQV